MQPAGDKSALQSKIPRLARICNKGNANIWVYSEDISYCKILQHLGWKPSLCEFPRVREGRQQHLSNLTRYQGLSSSKCGSILRKDIWWHGGNGSVWPVWAGFWFRLKQIQTSGKVEAQQWTGSQIWPQSSSAFYYIPSWHWTNFFISLDLHFFIYEMMIRIPIHSGAEKSNGTM